MLASETAEVISFTEIKSIRISFAHLNGMLHMSCESRGEGRVALRALRVRVSAGLKHQVEVKVRPWV